MGKRILVVDGNKEFVKGLAYDLNQDGYNVFALYEGKNAVKELGNQYYNLVLLDLELPDLSGLELCQDIRKKYTVPIIILSEKSNLMDQIVAMESGADDYLVKPFNVQELRTRIKAIFRRIEYSDGSKLEENLEIGDFTINTIGRTIEINSHEINLTGKEFDLFYVLITNPGKVFTREDLLRMVWGEDYFGDGRTIDVHIRRIRKKLLEAIDEDRYIQTKWGVGYYFEP